MEMENTGKYRAVVFDLDGTLLDTLEDIATAANATLAELGEPELELQAYRELVGEGVLSLLERAVRRESAGRHNLAQAVQRLVAAGFIDGAGGRGQQRRPRIAHLVDAMAETHQGRAFGKGVVEPGVGAVERADVVEHVEHGTGGAAMERPFESAEPRQH